MSDYFAPAERGLRGPIPRPPSTATPEPNPSARRARGTRWDGRSFRSEMTSGVSEHPRDSMISGCHALARDGIAASDHHGPVRPALCSRERQRRRRSSPRSRAAPTGLHAPRELRRCGVRRLARGAIHDPRQAYAELVASVGLLQHGLVTARDHLPPLSRPCARVVKQVPICATSVQHRLQTCSIMTHIAGGPVERGDDSRVNHPRGGQVPDVRRDSR